jgi:hypothetical protein
MAFNSRSFLFLIVAIFSVPALAQSKSSTPPSIEMKDLGFSEEITKSSPENQKILEDRRYYLHQHQVWGLVSVAAMSAAFLSGQEGEVPPEHPFLAGLAVASYGVAAYSAYMAPELPYGKEKGGSLWHRRLIWVHLPGMILTPILGYMAAKQVNRGDKISGAAQYHRDVATITAATLALSVLSVSIEF